MFGALVVRGSLKWWSEQRVPCDSVSGMHIREWQTTCGSKHLLVSCSCDVRKGLKFKCLFPVVYPSVLLSVDDGVTGSHCFDAGGVGVGCKSTASLSPSQYAFTM
jgi:hypothetical protein